MIRINLGLVVIEEYELSQCKIPDKFSIKSWKITSVTQRKRWHKYTRSFQNTK